MCGIKKRCITIHNAYKFSESFTHLSVSFASNFSFKNFLALVRKQSSLQKVYPEKLVARELLVQGHQVFIPTTKHCVIGLSKYFLESSDVCLVFLPVTSVQEIAFRLISCPREKAKNITILFLCSRNKLCHFLNLTGNDRS